MTRPRKRRRIRYQPNRTFFKPAGVRMRNLNIAKLRFEEVEALRLKNLENLNNQQAAEKMNVSRATFQRILNLAYKKITLALVHGQAISIEGGSYIKEDKEDRDKEEQDKKTKK